MVRFILFLLFLAGFAVGGKWLLDHPGAVHVEWFGYDVTLHTALVAFALVVLTLVIAFFSAMFWQVLTWPDRRRARRKYNTLARGLNQLTVGVTALAMGDEAAASEALKKALAALPNDPLPQLLTAQLLQRQGKHEDARAHFKALMKHEITAGLATRRLIEEHVKSREWLEATQLTEEARKDAPKDRWLVMTLLDLYAREKQAKAMLELTEGWQFQSPLTKEERHRNAAIAHYLNSTTQTNPHYKAQSLRHAVGYLPEFLPAVIDYAALQQSEGNVRRARKMLRHVWDQAPRTVLIAPILATFEQESPRAQERLLNTFLKGDMTAEQHLLVARHAMHRKEFERAKTELEAALALEENKTACSWMAEVEKELRGSDAANGWLARAMDAPSGKSWVCLDCGSITSLWAAHCTSCGHYDTLRYERPEARITSMEIATV